jgi:hypothetical protein
MSAGRFHPYSPTFSVRPAWLPGGDPCAFDDVRDGVLAQPQFAADQPIAAAPFPQVRAPWERGGRISVEWRFRTVGETPMNVLMFWPFPK